MYLEYSNCLSQEKRIRTSLREWCFREWVSPSHQWFKNNVHFSLAMQHCSLSSDNHRSLRSAWLQIPEDGCPRQVRQAGERQGEQEQPAEPNERAPFRSAASQEPGEAARRSSAGWDTNGQRDKWEWQAGFRYCLGESK